ncbi:hypothetical protein TNCV_3674271 [Trichonephila clavipes]|nr:hypothetical protein TNCV_3674271 [Trichonephila clavipes]
MAYTGTDAHTASTRCHSSSTIVIAYVDKEVTRPPWSRHFLLMIDLEKVEARVTAEHFLYHGRFVHYRRHAAVHYPTET